MAEDIDSPDILSTPDYPIPYDEINISDERPEGHQQIEVHIAPALNELASVLNRSNSDSNHQMEMDENNNIVTNLYQQNHAGAGMHSDALNYGPEKVASIVEHSTCSK